MRGAYYNEIDPYAAQWLRNLIAAGYIAPGDVDERSIEDVRPDDLRGYTQCHFFAGIGVWSLALRRAGWDDTRPVWTGSCPCQPFSAAGQGLGFADERHLWPSFHHLIRECQPAVVFGEQVASKDADPWIDLVQTDLEAVDYAFGAVPFPAASVGAPHIRDRLYWVADTDGRNARAERQQCGWEQRQQPQDGGSRGMASSGEGNAGSLSARRFAGTSDSTQSEIELREVGNGVRSSSAISERPGPVNGHWRAVDWLACRDGKWRPVEPMHVKMVDGNPTYMGYLCSGGYTETEKVNAELQTLRESADTEEVFERRSGIPLHDGEAQVLRQSMYGEGLRRDNKESDSAKQSPSISEDPVSEMRNLRTKRPSCSPSGRESDEQRPVELDDVVRLMSPSLTLAELYGNRSTAEGLRVLRQAIYEAGMVLHPYHSLQEVWASLGEEKKNRIRMGFDASRWERVVPFPLANGERNRVGRLRAYGNAINAYQAEIFVRAYLNG